MFDFYKNIQIIFQTLKNIIARKLFIEGFQIKKLDFKKF